MAEVHATGTLPLVIFSTHDSFHKPFRSIERAADVSSKHTLIKAGSYLHSSLFAYNIYNQCKHAVATAKWRRASEQTSNIWEPAQLTIAPCISELRFSFSCAPTAKLIQSNKYYKRIDNGAECSEKKCSLRRSFRFLRSFSLSPCRSFVRGPCTRRAPHRFTFHRTHVQHSRHQITQNLVQHTTHSLDAPNEK